MVSQSQLHPHRRTVSRRPASYPTGGFATARSIESPVHPQPLTWDEMALRLGAALAGGFLIGLERGSKRRPAGMRTMMMICLGCAAATIAGVQVLATRAPDDFGEISRVLQGILGGVGFLGAGVVLHRQEGVKGLTTAAAVWVASALGIACGLGEYTLAGMLTVAALFVLWALKPLDRLITREDSNNHAPRSPRSADAAP